MTKFVSDSLTAFRKKCSPLLSTSILFFASISIVLAVPITNDTIKDAGNLVEKIEKKAESSQRKLKELKKSLDSLKEDILDLALKNKKLKKGMSMAPVKKTGFFSFKKTKAELTKEIEQGIEEIRDLVAKQITIEKEINREKNMLAEEQTQFTHVKFKLAKLKEDLAKQNKKIADAAKL
ncbi:MAG: hypothetical protein U9O87_03245, partial [Verrucomicrobiota bacterium]|nr:hypothetical protein [Verrucomicrobiota bacterium]